MIADFPEAKKVIKKALDATLRQQVKQKAPTLSLVPRKSLFEGDKMSVYRPDGSKSINEFRRVQSEFTISKKEAETGASGDIMEKISLAAEDMAGQMERGFFQTLTETIENAGNVIPGNPALTPDAILKGLEMITVDFEDDDREKPRRPTIVAAPGAVDDLMRAEAARSEAEKLLYKEKEKAILDKKYEEHMADLESRKIVD